MISVVYIDFLDLDRLVADTCTVRLPCFHIDILVLVLRLRSSIMYYNCKISSTFTMCNIWHASLFRIIKCSRFHLLHRESSESCFLNFIYYIANPVNLVFIFLHLEEYTPLDAITESVRAVGTSWCIYFTTSDLNVKAFNSFRVVIGVLAASNMTFLLFLSPRLWGQLAPDRWMSRVLPFFVITGSAELQFNDFQKRQVDFKVIKVGKPCCKAHKRTYNV